MLHPVNTVLHTVCCTILLNQTCIHPLVPVPLNLALHLNWRILWNVLSRIQTYTATLHKDKNDVDNPATKPDTKITDPSEKYTLQMKQTYSVWWHFVL